MEINDIASLSGLDDTAEEATSRSSVYEIGYHLLPTLSEAEMQAVAQSLSNFLKAQIAVTVGEHAPVKVPLAYTITKRIAGKLMRFNEAYFGWVAFEVSRENIQKIKEMLDIHPSMLRYLIIRTDRETIAAALTGAVAATSSGDIGKPRREIETGGEMSEAALEEALQTIATEDAKAAE